MLRKLETIGERAGRLRRETATRDYARLRREFWRNKELDRIEVLP